MNNLQQDFLIQSIDALESLVEQLHVENRAESFSENFARDAFRTLHTIKGTSQTFGYPVSGTLAHELENLLTSAKNRQSSASESYKSLFLEGVRLLKKTFEDGNFEIPAAFLEKMRAVAPHENDSETFSSEMPKEIFSQLSGREKGSVNAALRSSKNLFCLEIGFDLSAFADGLTNFREALSECCEIIATLPSAKPSAHGKIGFQIFLATSESSANIEEIAGKHSAEIVFQTARENFSNDLTGVVAQVVAHGKNLARQFGKEIEFKVSGDELEISPRLLKIVFDALLHLVRNAVDHAIEPSEERIIKNKKPKGEIEFQFVVEESSFRLTVSDDGRGIDAEKVKAKAIEKNLISSDKILSEQETLNLIFAPEFSTAERLTEVSGRGVGLDAVKDLVEKAGGKITVKSEKEKGTVFEIHLPREE
ncbi:MAG: ATP-binding protein [Acidobacteriota bacterium]|nr:ATP-binding protein [Acidobacteriota bacterium]